MSISLALPLCARAELVADSYSFTLYFPKSESEIKPEFAGNVFAMDSIKNLLEEVKTDSCLWVKSLAIESSTSPEESKKFNQELRLKRANSLLAQIQSCYHVPTDSILVSTDPGDPAGSEATHHIHRNVGRTQYPFLRYAKATFLIDRCAASCYTPIEDEAEDRAEVQADLDCEIISDHSVEKEPQVCVGHEPSPHPTRLFRLKTNGLGWAMLVGNVAVEFDLADRWSIAVPIYYSALNYFTSTLKFRTLCVQPEARFWLSDSHRGWFVGAHLGAGYFNYAYGDYRVQDTRGTHPAYGGGFSAGWRFNLSADGRWQMELAAGVGAYRARYDKFDNTTNGECVVSNASHTFFGIDQAAVSVSYSFGRANKTKQHPAR